MAFSQVVQLARQLEAFELQLQDLAEEILKLEQRRREVRARRHVLLEKIQKAVHAEMYGAAQEAEEQQSPHGD